MNEEVPKAGKPPDVLSVEELEEILDEFDPMHNIEDKKLVHYLAGRRIPEEELQHLYNMSKSTSLPSASMLRKLTMSLATGRKRKAPGNGVSDVAST